MHKGLITICILILSSCTTVSYQQKINYEANNALNKEQYEVAKQKYEASLKAAQSNNDIQYEAIAMYGLGRSYGYLCEYDEAEKWFLKSIALRANIPDSKIAYLTQNYLELARLYKSGKKYRNANAQFERAIPILEDLEIQSKDPIGYANVLEDYVFTLQESGNHNQATKIQSLIEKLRDKYPNRKADFIATQYPVNCKK